MRTINGAVEIALFTPLDIIGHYQVELAVAIVVHPRGAGGKLVGSPEPGGFCDIGEGAVAIVVEQMTLAQRSDKDVIETIVVVVSHRNTKSKHGKGKPGAAGNVGEGAVMIVVIELHRGGPGMRMAGEIVAIDQQDVGISVVIVVDEGTPRPHGFRKPLLAKCAIVVGEVDARRRSNVAEMRLLLGIGSGNQKQGNEPRNHGGPEDRGEKTKTIPSVTG